jgi:NAD(P)-dependent dehydrogenase (short-subunit alcohol dehydrogenase family)
MKMFDLTGKTALVTGGGRGIGKAIAVALAEAGANVAIVSRTEQQLIDTSKEIEEFGVNVYYKALDVTNTEDIKKYVKELVNIEGKIDILVNAAGTNRRLPLLEVTPQDFDYVLNLNLKSVLFTTQAVIPYMVRQKYGKIINITSLTSVLGFNNMTLYGSSKGGVSQFTKAVAVEFAKDGIRSNAIGPGYFETEMTKPVFENPERVAWMNSRIPLGRTGHTDELKGAAVYLASPASDYVTGQTIYVDGGWLVY